MSRSADSVAAMLAADAASAGAGIEVSDVGPGTATARMPVDDRMINGHGICHGGDVFMVAGTPFARARHTYSATTGAAGPATTFVSDARARARPPACTIP